MLAVLEFIFLLACFVSGLVIAIALFIGLVFPEHPDEDRRAAQQERAARSSLYH